MDEGFNRPGGRSSCSKAKEKQKETSQKKYMQGNTASPPTEEGLKKMMRGFCVDDVGRIF